MVVGRPPRILKVACPVSGRIIRSRVPPMLILQTDLKHHEMQLAIGQLDGLTYRKVIQLLRIILPGSSTSMIRTYKRSSIANISFYTTSRHNFRNIYKLYAAGKQFYLRLPHDDAQMGKCQVASHKENLICHYLYDFDSSCTVRAD